MDPPVVFPVPRRFGAGGGRGDRIPPGDAGPEVRGPGDGPGIRQPKARERFGDSSRYRGEALRVERSRIREQNRVLFMDNLRQDLRFALRQLWKRPAFSAIALGMLALGIGANTAIFSVVYAVLLKPLPFNEPDRIVRIWESRVEQGWDTGFRGPRKLLGPAGHEPGLRGSGGVPVLLGEPHRNRPPRTAERGSGDLGFLRSGPRGPSGPGQDLSSGGGPTRRGRSGGPPGQPSSGRATSEETRRFWRAV